MGFETRTISSDSLSCGTVEWQTVDLDGHPTYVTFPSGHEAMLHITTPGRYLVGLKASENGTLETIVEPF